MHMYRYTMYVYFKPKFRDLFSKKHCPHIMYQPPWASGRASSYYTIGFWFWASVIEEWVLEAKTECYPMDKVKSLPFFWLSNEVKNMQSFAEQSVFASVFYLWPPLWVLPLISINCEFWNLQYVRKLCSKILLPALVWFLEYSVFAEDVTYWRKYILC